MIMTTGALETLAILVHAAPMHAGGIRIRSVHAAEQIKLIRDGLIYGDELGDPSCIWLLCVDGYGTPTEPGMLVQEAYFNAGVASATARSFLALLGIHSRVVHPAQTLTESGHYDEIFGDDAVVGILAFGYEGDSL